MKYARCCLCGCAFDSENQWNAEPVKTGVCCQPCFASVVLKARRTMPPQFLRGRKTKIYKVVWEEKGQTQYTHVFTKTKAEAVEAFREICKQQEVYPDDGSVLFYALQKGEISWKNYGY